MTYPTKEMTKSIKLLRSGTYAYFSSGLGKYPHKYEQMVLQLGFHSSLKRH